MKYFTTAQWAQIWNMSMGDMEQGLMELGYQILDTTGNLTWKLTEKGRAHAKKSRNPFDKTLRWDFEAFFDVAKHFGRKTRSYFYCPECGDYLNHQHGFEATMDKWVCKKCGLVNDLTDEYERAKELEQKYRDILSGEVPKQADAIVPEVLCKCSKCGREAYDIDEINVIFGFIKAKDGKLVPHTECKACRKKI